MQYCTRIYNPNLSLISKNKGGLERATYATVNILIHYPLEIETIAPYKEDCAKGNSEIHFEK